MQQDTSILNKTMQNSLNAATWILKSGHPYFSLRQWCKRWYDTFPPKRTLRDKELLHQQNAESEWENFPLSLFSHPQRRFAALLTQKWTWWEREGGGGGRFMLSLESGEKMLMSRIHRCIFVMHGRNREGLRVKTSQTKVVVGYCDNWW